MSSMAEHPALSLVGQEAICYMTGRRQAGAFLAVVAELVDAQR